MCHASCSSNHSLHGKRFQQRSHWYGFRLQSVRRWRSKSPRCVNVLIQLGHLCRINRWIASTWTRRDEASVYDFVQRTHWNCFLTNCSLLPLNRSTLFWCLIVNRCVIKLPFRLNDCPQGEQTKSRLFSWTVDSWMSSFCFELNDLWHQTQKCGFNFSWTARTCRVKSPFVVAWYSHCSQAKRCFSWTERLCFVKFPLLMNSLPHFGHLNLINKWIACTWRRNPTWLPYCFQQ